MSKKNYKILDSNTREGWNVHHIDWDHKNDNIDNLIVIPKKIHELVHEYLGYINRVELTKLVEVFESFKNYRNKSTYYLSVKLSEYINTDKTSKLAISCREKLGKLKEPKVRKVNYRKLYETVNGDITKGWEIHHIDWNHENNDINNLISVPNKIHWLVHKYLGYVNREELEKVLKVFNNSNYPPTASLGYLNHHLSKYVNTNKGDCLSIKCKVSMEHSILVYQQAFEWRDGKGGMF